MARYAEWTIAEYLDRLGSKASAPGGGSVAALTAAQGAALVAMVAHLTLGRPEFANHDRETASILTAAEDLRLACLRGVDDDAAVLETLMATYKLPRSTPEERRARGEALQAALLAAATSPYDLARRAAAIVPLCQRLLPIGNPTVRSDLGVAALCASAAFHAARINVLTNTKHLADRARARAFEGDLRSWQAALETDVATLLNAVDTGAS